MPSSPESQTGRLQDVMDLFSSDPITGQTTPRAIPKIDRKGKGRAVPVPVLLPVEANRRTSFARDVSPEFDGITSPVKEAGRKVGKRKSEDGTAGSKRIRTVSEIEVRPTVFPEAYMTEDRSLRLFRPSRHQLLKRPKPKRKSANSSKGTKPRWVAIACLPIRQILTPVIGSQRGREVVSTKVGRCE